MSDLESNGNISSPEGIITITDGETLLSSVEVFTSTRNENIIHGDETFYLDAETDKTTATENEKLYYYLKNNVTSDTQFASLSIFTISL